MHISEEFFVFKGLSRARAPLQNLSLNTEKTVLNKMALGHLGQFRNSSW